MNFLFSKKVLAPRKGCLIAGFLYWPAYLVGLGVAMSVLMELCGMDINSNEGFTILNIACFTVNFMVILLIFRRFLFDSLQDAKGRFFHFFLSALMGYGLCSFLSFQIEFVYILFQLTPENLNQDSVTDLLQRAPWQMVICTVFFAPVVEECMVRGLIFGPLARKLPVLGYILSVVVFSGIHVVGAIGTTDWLTILLCFIQYLPHSIALAWAYHRSGNIIAPIFLHAAINLMGVVVELGGFV